MTTSVLENPETRKMFVPISVKAYHQLLQTNYEEYVKTELIEGVIVKKMTKGADHNFYSNFLYEEIRKLIPVNTIILSEKPLTLVRSEPEPDISVVEGDIYKYRNENPTTAILVIEIAVTSLVSDRQKIPIYSEGNVKNYWIVNVEKKEVETYSDPKDGKFTVEKIYTKENDIPIFGKSISLQNIFQD
ncbi:MAG: Uma2 family endonuclease [Leptospiraceae bacterium]|nr:Uma2 family endonuclease [Leptospiraceae bacterium]